MKAEKGGRRKRRVGETKEDVSIVIRKPFTPLNF